MRGALLGLRCMALYLGTAGLGGLVYVVTSPCPDMVVFYVDIHSHSGGTQGASAVSAGIRSEI